MNAHFSMNSALASSSDIVKPAVIDATVVLDINHSFWTNLATRMKADTHVVTISNGMHLAADTTICDFPCDSWPIAAHAEVMYYMVRILFMYLLFFHLK